MLPKLLGLMKGDLQPISKNGEKILRQLNPDRNYISKDEKNISSWSSFTSKQKCRSFDD